MAEDPTLPASRFTILDEPVAAPAETSRFTVLEEEPEYGTIEGIARGVGAAPVEFARGLAELGALGIDAGFGTDYVDSVSSAFDAADEFIGAPETGAGAVTRDLLVFGAGFIPIAGWLGRAGQVAKTGQTLNASSRFMRSAERFGKTKQGRALLGNRAKVLGATALASGLYEGVISSGGRSTLSDNIEFLPEALKTEADTGLTGREEAYRQLRNRARQAAEGAALSAVVDSSIFALGRGSRALGSAPVIGPTLSATARASQQGWNTLGRFAGMVPGAQTAKREAVRLFAPGGGLDPRIRGAIADVQGVSDDVKANIASALSRYDKAARKVAKESARRSQRADFMQQMEKDVLDYLDTPVGDRLGLRYGEDFQKSVDDLSEISSELEDALIKTLEDVVRSSPSVSDPGITPGLISRGSQKEQAEAALKIIRANRESGKTHLTRLYQLHSDPAALYKSLGGENILQNETFKRAEDTLTSIRIGKGGPSVDPAVAREAARRTLLDMLNIKPLTGDLTPENIKRQIDARMRTIREDVLGTGRGLVAQDTPIFKLEQGILQQREELMEYAPIRALLGETTSPRERMGAMLDNLTSLNTSMNFYNQQAGSSLKAASAIPEIAAGKRPAYVYLPGSSRSADVAGEFAELSEVKQIRELLGGGGDTTQNISEAAEEALRREGYVRLGEENLDSVVGGRFGQLSGMFVPRELYDSLTAPLQLNLNPVSQVGSILTQMKGLTQKMTVVPNPASRVRDLIGNKLMTVASGNLDSGLGQTDSQVLSTIFRAVQNLDQDGTQALARKLNLAGVTDSSVLLNQIQGLKQTGPEFGVPQKLRRGIEALEAKTPVLAPMMDFFEKTTRGVDALAKTRVLLSEEAKLREVMGAFADSEPQRDALVDWMERSGLAARSRSEADMLGPMASVGRGAAAQRALDPVETIAADRTRRFMPTYSEIGLAVRETDRLLPFGNFVSFASENIRNMANILETGVKELAATVDDDLIRAMGSRERAEQFVRAMRGLGSQRLTGLLTVAQIVPKAMVRAGQDATGMTDEQMERMYEQTDYFQKGQDLVPLEFSGDGKLKYINLSYTAPYSFVTDSVQAALRGYRERGRLNQSEVEQIGGSVYDLVGSLADPFASESIFFERVRDALPSGGPGSLGIGRGGITQTGAKVWEETDSWGSKASQGFLHVLDSVVPSVVKLGVTAQKGELEPGRLTRAMLDVPDARGREFTIAEEIGRQITGFTPMEIDLQRDFEFSGKAYAPRRSTAKQTANRMIRRSDATVEDILGSWDNYLDSLYREQSRLYNDIEAARTLGLSEAQIRRNLIQKANLGTAEVNNIMQGKFWPGLASSEIRQEVVRQVAQEDRPRITRTVPWSELNRRSNARRRQDLDPAMFRRRLEETAETVAPPPSAAEQGRFTVLEEAQAPASAPILSPAPAAPAAPAPPPIQTAPGQPPPADLLGSNPLDQLRNLEIFNRGQ